MLLFKFISYLAGYVMITVPQHCVEKFVNLAITRGILLWDITNTGADRVLVKVRLNNVQPLRHVARMTRCRFKITGKVGLPFLMGRLKRRKALPAGALIFIIALYALSSFVWTVEVMGNKDIATEAIEQVAREAGLHRGVLKWSVNPAWMEDEILRQVPELSWVGVQMDGTRVRIEVVEKVLPVGDDDGKPVDVVAAKDGLIKEILVLSGNPLVEEGESVRAGQVLITAAIQPPDKDDNSLEEENSADWQEAREPVQYVRARGFIRARVWYEGYGEMQLVERGVAPTGREKTRLGIKIGAKEIILMGPRVAPYTSYDLHTDAKKLPAWRNLSLPVELIKVKYFEKEQYIKNHGLNQARRLAGEQAWAVVEAQLPPGARILNRRSQVVDTALPEGLVRVKVVVETLEDIGMEKPYQRVEPEDPAKEVTSLF